MDILDIYNTHNHFGKLLGMTYSIINSGEVSYCLEVKQEHLATKTAAHGGLLAGFMDAVIGVAALSAVVEDKKVVSTIEFKISYLKPALLGDRLIGKGLVLQKGNRIIVTEGKIYNQHNELICIATGTLNSYPLEKSDFNS